MFRDGFFVQKPGKAKHFASGICAVPPIKSNNIFQIYISCIKKSKKLYLVGAFFTKICYNTKYIY